MTLAHTCRLQLTCLLFGLATFSLAMQDVPVPHVARWHLGTPWLPPIIAAPQPSCQITSLGAPGNPSIGWASGWTTVTMSNTTTDPSVPPNPRFNPNTWVTSATMTSSCGQPLPPALPLPLPYTFNYYPSVSNCLYTGTVKGPGGIGTCSLKVFTAPPLCSISSPSYNTDCNNYYLAPKGTTAQTTESLNLNYAGGGPWTAASIPKVLSLTNPPGGLPQTLAVSIQNYTATISGPGGSRTCTSSVQMNCVCVNQPGWQPYCNPMPGGSGANQVAFNDPGHGCPGQGKLLLRGWEWPRFLYPPLFVNDAPSCTWIEVCEKNKPKVGWTVYKIQFATRGCNPGCFAPDERITLFGGGSKRASEITGEEPLWNPILHQPMRVKKIIRGPEKYPLIEIGFGGKVVHVTRKHPMMTPKGIRAAEAITLKDSILGPDLQYHPVEIAHRLALRKGIVVYNFEIDTTSNDPSAHALEAGGIVTGDYYLQVQLETGHFPKQVTDGREGLH